MGDSWVQIKVRKSDKERLMIECVEEFMHAHPEFDGKKITQAHIFRQVINYYLGD